jgi:hypothetical protein
MNQGAFLLVLLALTPTPARPSMAKCRPVSPSLIYMDVLETEPVEIPLVGRPADLPFSEASAGFVRLPGPEYRVPFSVESSASLTDVEELADILFTVSVRAHGRVQQPPSRIDLRQVSAFSARFHIEDVTDRKIELSSASWRWIYRLRPRSAGIDEIPGVPFVFYNPDLRPAEKGYQVIWTDPLTLRVRSAERLALPVEAPASVLELATGSEVLLARSSWAGPTGGLVLLVVASPPLLCLGWYWLWRRLYRDANRLVQLRRSRAARRAIHAIDRARRQHGRVRAEEVARAVASYLAERFDLHQAEPTPIETATWLRERGLSAELVDRGQGVLDACARTRFQPETGDSDLPGEASQWIDAIEEALCPPSS